MNPDIAREITLIKRRLDEIERGRGEVSDNWDRVISLFQTIPGLVGFWPMSSVELSTGDAYDLSGQGRTLLYNGNPVYRLHNDLVPYLDFDGTGDILTRADETDLDILGTETIYANPGLTIGGWFWSDSIATQMALTGKFLAAGDERSYLLQFVSGGANFGVSSLGTAATVVTVSSAALATGAWYFVVGRFTPSVELAVFVNGVKVINTFSIPASIFNSAAGFTIGGAAGSLLLLDGRASLCFLSANALPDSFIDRLFRTTKTAFGV